MSSNPYRALEAMNIETSHGAAAGRSLKRLRSFNICALFAFILMGIITLVTITIYPAVQHEIIPLHVVIGLGATTTILAVVWLILRSVARSQKKRNIYDNQVSSPQVGNILARNAGSHRRPSIAPSEGAFPANAGERASAYWHSLCVNVGSFKKACSGGRRVVVPEPQAGSMRPVVRGDWTAVYPQGPDVGSQFPPAYSYHRMDENTAYAGAGATVSRTSVEDGDSKHNNIYSDTEEPVEETRFIPPQPADPSAAAAAQPPTAGLTSGRKTPDPARHNTPAQNLTSSSREIGSILNPLGANPPFPSRATSTFQRLGSRTPSHEAQPKVVPPDRPSTACEYGTAYSERQRRMEGQRVDARPGPGPRVRRSGPESSELPEEEPGLKSGAEDFGYHHSYGRK